MDAHTLQRSLRMVIVAIAFGMVFFAITTGSPLTGFARKLGAGDFLFGVLMALPIVGGVFQLVTAYWLEKLRRRKKIFMIACFLQRAVWLPIAFVPFFIPPHWPGLRIWVVISLLCLSSFGSSVSSVPFLSWMGDLVPDQIRGRYFSRRNAISTVSASIGGLAAGYFLDLNNNFTGFAIVFTAAALFGIVDILCFIWVKEPPFTSGESVPFTKMMTMPFRERNFRRYMFFWAAWSFGVNVTGPFFSVYLLENLRLHYLEIVLCTQLVSSLATVLFARMWGRLADTHGSKPVMMLCGLGAMTLPCFWLLPAARAAYTLWVVAGINFLGGAFWSGIDVTNLHLLLSCSPEKNRSMFIAGFNMFTALIGGVLAYLAGGLFLDLTSFVTRLHWPLLYGNHLTNYHLLFILSALLRALALFIGLPRLSQPSASDTKQVARALLRGRSEAGRSRSG